MMSLLQGFHPASREPQGRGSGEFPRVVLEWANSPCLAADMLCLERVCCSHPGHPRVEIDSATCWGTLIKSRLWFHLENEVLVFKGWALVQRKKSMVYLLTFL